MTRSTAGLGYTLFDTPLGECAIAWNGTGVVAIHLPEGRTDATRRRLLDTGMRKNGQKLDPFMPLEMLTNMDETERKALWAYLQSVPALELGNR